MAGAYTREREVAIEAVRQAARICRAVQATITPDVLEKKDRSPVTIADYGSQAVVCRLVGEAFPSDPIVGEEEAAQLRSPENAEFLQRVHREITQLYGDVSPDQICGWIDRGGADATGRRYWTLDPIDGTKGFLRKEQYAIALALLVDGRIDVAVLGCPNLPLTPGGADHGAVFYAVRGEGAYVVPLEGNAAPRPVRVSQTNETRSARFCESVESGHSSHSDSQAIAERLGITAAPVRLDSQAKYAVVARGEADIYLRLPTKADYFECIWDHAGGVLIVEEAGGRVTDVAGRSLDFTKGRKLTGNRGVVVTNGRIHDAVVSAVQAVGVK
ncbi:MAG TPA: 3'(2'),5'-bisphosphate nucleotidase [Lacipirellula sp.]